MDRRPLAVALCLLVAGCASGGTGGEALARRVPTTTAAPESLRTTTSSTAPGAISTSTSSTVPSGSGVVLEADGLAVVAFGDDAMVVTAELSSRLGPPTDDAPLPSCPSGEIDRLVDFGGLSVLFAATGGVERFVAWDLGPSSGLQPRLATTEGISVGSSLDQLRSAYGDRLELSRDDPFGSGFEVELQAGGRLGGTLTGTAGADTVATLSGGTASCAG